MQALGARQAARVAQDQIVILRPFEALAHAADVEQPIAPIRARDD
jgi:hypothetical protein